MADSSSVGSSTSTSTSTPVVVRTPENDLLDQIAGYAQQLAGNMYGWAQGVYAHTSAITDQAVQNFFNVSQQMTGLANNMTGQYNNLFAPENAQLVADANSYASPERMAVDMGMAGATQSQAGDQAIKNSEQNLLSYGIDPSAGRYAALDKAAAVQNAANVAGAENLQRQADIATGQRLRSEAVQVGAQLPAAIANANNTAIQANTGASNATLANANTGANLMSLSDKYLQTAMGLKLPLMGQNSNSQSNSQQMGRSNGGDGGSRSGGGGGGGNGGGNGVGGGGGSGPAWMPNHGDAQSHGGAGSFGRAFPSGSNIHNVPPGMQNPGDPIGQGSESINPETGLSNNLNGIDFDQWTNGGFGAGNSTGEGTLGPDGAAVPELADYNQSPFANGGFGDTWDYGGSNGTFGNLPDFQNSDLGLGNITYDPSANPSQGDWTNGGSGGGWGDYSQPVNTNMSGGDVWTQGSGVDYSNQGDVGSFGADYGDGYADGGPVPQSASPSGGAQVDDVPAQMPSGGPARLNANEFVVPRDVAQWKGQEFFHNLIAQSRKKRAMMQAAVPVGPNPLPMAR